MSNSTGAYSQAYLDEDIGWRLKAVAISFLILDCGFVVLRFYARYLQKKSLRYLNLDDWLMIAALIFCLGTQTIAFSVGRHVEYTSQYYDKFRTWYQTCLIAVPVMYMFSAALPKLAILCLYLQIFVDKLSRWSTYATMGAIIINVIIMVPILIAKCRPISYGWKVLLDPELTGGWCANVEPRLQFCSVANIVTDVAMLLLPIPTLRKLKTDKGTMIGLTLTFGMALAGLITSCFRFGAFFHTAAYEDGTWASVNLVAWCIVEPGIYMFVASQMAFRPLVVALFRTRAGSRIVKLASRPFSKYKSADTKTVDTSAEEKLRTSIPDFNPLGYTLHETTVEAEVSRIPSAPASLYSGNIWIRHEYTVGSFREPRHASDTSNTSTGTRRPSSC